MKYKLFIFDLDGTVLDTSKGILSAIKKVFIKNGLPVFSDEEMKTYIGPPIEYTFKRNLSLTDEEIKKIAGEFRDEYFGKHLYEATSFDGMEELLISCKEKGITCAIATNKRENFSRELIEKFGLSKYFAVVRGTDPEGKLTKSDIISLCLQDLNVERKYALMIGDAHSDEKGAKEADVDFAAAMYGFGFNEKSEIECVARVYSPQELLKLY